MVDWVAALNGIATAVQITKELRAIDQSVDAAASRAQLVTLMEQLSDVRIQLIDAREEAREREEEINRLSALSTNVEAKLFQGGFYFDVREDGSPKGTPYCPHCIETKTGLFHMRQMRTSGMPWECAKCGTEYMYAPSFDWE